MKMLYRNAQRRILIFLLELKILFHFSLSCTCTGNRSQDCSSDWVNEQHGSPAPELEGLPGSGPLRLQTAPGDSLLASACTTYLGPMDEATRDLVLADWLRACRSGSYHVGAGRTSAMSGVDPSLAASPALNMVTTCNFSSNLEYIIVPLN